MRRAILAIFLLVATLLTPTSGRAQSGFLETFDGAPSSPQSWQPTNWAVDTNADVINGVMDLMQAHHGGDCVGHPNTHPVSTLEHSVFQCNGHIMTSMSAGYGATYITPPAMLDISSGEAILRFDMSTFRTVGRDWVDVWITPYEDQLTLPLEEWMPVYQGEPKRGIHIRMDGASGGGTLFRVGIVRDYDQDVLPSADWRGYEQVLVPSATRRDTFEVRLTKTHIQFGMPDYNIYWANSAISPALDWDDAVVQLGHHAYNPTKACDEDGNLIDEEGACANTWHWDNVSISPSLPLDIIPTSPRWATTDAWDGTAHVLTLQRPAPANAMARFAAIGANVELSFDNGATWTAATRKSLEQYAPEHYSSYHAAVPEGTTAIKVRATSHSYIHWWLVTHLNVLSRGESGPIPTPTATLPPTDTPTPGPTNTPTATATVTATPTATPTPASGELTVTFNDKAGQNQPLNGQYPAGVIDWGTGQWYHSGPYGQFATKSASFTSGGTSRSFSFVTPRVLASLKAFNGGGAGSTVALSCGGQTVSQVVPSGQVATITTGWASPCTTVTVTSSNGWDTNFDDLVIQ